MGGSIDGKGLYDFLAEDAGLTDKITVEEFQNKKAVPNNSDDEIDKVYKTYCTLLEKNVD
ncbi:MAG: hypothetical protein K2K46_14045 [Lachnospiraceae bacterium]|nr:hypothetical protein [Lachnospiraceae bacterium]